MSSRRHGKRQDLRSVLFTRKEVVDSVKTELTAESTRKVPR
jgi:hypothetical protein